MRHRVVVLSAGFVCANAYHSSEELYPTPFARMDVYLGSGKMKVN